GVLDREFLNARGAIARFSRGSIEIRVLDVQESPLADVSICALIIHVLRQLVAERWTPVEDQMRMPVASLERLLISTIRNAEQTIVDDGEFLRCFGLDHMTGAPAADVWRVMIDDAADRN